MNYFILGFLIPRGCGKGTIDRYLQCSIKKAVMAIYGNKAEKKWLYVL